MEQLVARPRRAAASTATRWRRETVFVSHETYTPARGGSAAAEINALRAVFGADADRIVIANTKGFTGHPMGVGIEDVVAVKALETGIVPPVPNFKEADPELGELNLSHRRRLPGALRAAAGRRLRLADQHDAAALDAGRRTAATAAPSELGYAYRIADPAAWHGVAAPHQRPRTTPTLEVDPAPPAGGRPTAAPAGGAVHRPPEASAPRRSRTERSTVHRRRPRQPSATVADRRRPAEAESAPPAAAPAPRRRGRRGVASGCWRWSPSRPATPPTCSTSTSTSKPTSASTPSSRPRCSPRSARPTASTATTTLKLRDYPTLDHVIGFVRDRAPAPPATAPARRTAGAAARAAAAAARRRAARRAGRATRSTARVLALVAEQTGYPADMLDLDLDLEADLGIDTVKQAELFATIREAYGIERDDNLKLRDYPTLNHVDRLRPRPRPATPDTAAAAPAAGARRPRRRAASPRRPTAPAARRVDGAGAGGGRRADRLPRRPARPRPRPRSRPRHRHRQAGRGVRRDPRAPTASTATTTLKLRDYPTLNHVIGFVRDRAGIAPDAARRRDAAAARAPRRHRPRAPPTASPRLPAPRARCRSCARRSTRCAPTGVALGAGQPGRRDARPRRRGDGAASSGCAKLGVEVLAIDGDAGRRGARRASSTAWTAAGPIQGVYWLPALDDEGDARGARPRRLARGAARAGQAARRHHARAVRARRRAGTFLVAATRLGGRHGYDAGGRHVASMGGAVTGFTKALARERADALVKAVDFAAGRRPRRVADGLRRRDAARPGRRRDRPRRRPALDGRPASSEPRRPTMPGARARPPTRSSSSPARPAASSRRSPPTWPAASGGTFHLLDLVARARPGRPRPRALRHRPRRPEARAGRAHHASAASGRRPTLVERELAAHRARARRARRDRRGRARPAARPTGTRST